jgi:hypothetical protein
MKRLLPVIVLTTIMAAGMKPAHGQVNEIRKVLEGILGAPTPDAIIPTPKPNKPDTPSYPQGALTRAMNLARQAAETENGGLNYYRAEPSMYGPAIDAPFVDNKDGSLTFTFLGGAPAYPPSIQSIVTVQTAGLLVTIDYNGPIQTATE